jgi:hypothetical protein
MLDTIRLYFDATLAVAIMVTLGVIAGFVAAALTDDRALILATVVIVFGLTGAALLVRLWLMLHRPAAPQDPPVDN